MSRELLRRRVARGVRRALLMLAAVVATQLLGAASVQAVDDYTLPFYDRDVTLLYGVDRDPRASIQLDYTGKTWFDADPHPGRVYDNHTGLDYPMPLRSPVAAAKDGVVADTEGGYGTQQFGNFGNFVRVRHDDGRHTLYYHLASRGDGGIAVAFNEDVVFGEQVGLSGCSGLCFGPHLHFEVLRESGKFLLTSDPMFNRLWTTWPGRVPFAASYHRESNGGTEIVRPGRTIAHWVEFRNIGGRPWRPGPWPGRIVLGTWKPPQHASPFAASDWTSSWLATRVEQNAVGPDEIGRFSFGIRGGAPPGSYDETFNLLSHGVHWFDHNLLGGFHVPIIVSNLSE
ncbi:MAG TPA: M23 family metallopeptidase [Candidatus Limnocylindria bacterium]|jgi:murein DD-endopeptidase MepM/ murein hydrolase activator NlpD